MFLYLNQIIIYMSIVGGIFRTLSNNYDEAF